MKEKFKLRMRFDFTFFAVVAFLVFVDTQGTAILSLIACILHEGGHLFAMAVCGVQPECVTFYGGGIAISKRLDFCPFGKRIFILSAGCLTNALIAASCLLTMPDNKYAEIFAAVNILILSFNLLPLGYFDGAQLLDTLLTRLMSYKTALVTKRVIGVLTSAALIGGVILYAVYYKETVSLSLGFVILYLLIAQFIE
ncbi:MAG: M50 family metallopeptidase [Eubacterium sp.]|nr:M50 family metallopeptidase [Eubacterium sp.]